MHRIVHAMLALVTVASTVLAAPPAADVKGVVAGNNAFALDLYAKLSQEKGNLFFSPYSISTALAMTYAGARGNTETQMATALHFGLGQEPLHAAFHNLLEATRGGDKRGYQLSVANALWGQQGYGFLDQFLKVTQAHYGAGLRQVDFRGATEAARQRINLWVEKQTNGKIKDLIQPGILDELTRLVLTNAIYFKGDWASQFKKAATRDAPFTLAGGKTTTAPLMYQRQKFGYAESRDAQALEMPYVGEDLSMIVLLPRKADGLAALEASLSADTLNGWLGRMRHPRTVRVYLPRFKMTSAFRLGQQLKVMGMPDAFNARKADFSGMDGREDHLYIAAVIHKAFVEVNEEGTEAAAATAVVMKARSARIPRDPVFRADRPFLFLIRHKPTGSILFMGRVADPTK
ncbi:serpin family protein [bacterium]|nr:serpin family protein [bacterium]